MYRNPNPACTKTLKWRQPNERNVTGSSITINFHSRCGKKNLSKTTKNVPNFTDAIRCVNACSNLIIRVSFSHKFCSYFIGSEFNFELICTLPFLFSKVQAAALNPLSVFKTLLKAHRSPCFRRGWGKENKFEGSVHLDLPFWGHLNIDLCFSFSF